MEKQQLRKFREHYFPGKTIFKSRSLMAKQFGITERRIRSWEGGQRPIQNWFVKVAKRIDKSEILKEK